MLALNGFIAYRASDWGNYRVPGTKRYLRVRREMAPLLIGFAAEFHKLVEPIDQGRLDDWGAYARKVRGRSNLSFHSAGLAIDLNALRHPLGKRGTFTRRQQATIRELCKKYGLRWGGDYRGRKDEMHFEVILKRAAALALVQKVQSPRPVKTSKPRVEIRLAKLVPGLKNSDIVQLQMRLVQLGYRIDTDGIYGPKTLAAVQRFQKKQGWHGSDADGRVGPVTLQRMF